jgi:DNA-binding LytR/AlgR family response regulator
MTTALIAEDEPLLLQSLERALKLAWPELQIVARTSTGDEALAAAVQQRPDICFFDVRMPTLSGLEVAHALAEDWIDTQSQAFPLLVFVTAYDQYAVAAFEAQAADYLLKPVDPKRLAQCVERLQARLSTSQPKPVTTEETLMRLAAQLSELKRSVQPQPAPSAKPLTVLQAGLGNELRIVPVEDVLAIEAADRYLRVFTASAEHLLRMSLRDLHAQLAAEDFWQIHRSTLVRAKSIERVYPAPSGRLALRLKGMEREWHVSRIYAAQFKAM